MKTFNNSVDAYQYIMSKGNDGDEEIMNEALHFGVGDSTYVFLEDAIIAGLDKIVHYYEGKNPLFVTLTNEGLKKFLEVQRVLIIY